MTRAGDWYQESIKDTIKMLEFYGDVIVMRHFQQGAPMEAAKWASVPIINGGDGWGEHPTQILTDLYTVLREKGRIDGLRWLAVGDMRMRTMHSLGYALTQFDCPITFVAPPEMSLTEEFKSELKNYSLNFREADHVEQAIAEADVILVEPVVQPDYTKSRQEAGEHGMTPAITRLHESCYRRRRNLTQSCCTRCPVWMKFLPMSTSRAGHATGRRPSTALSCACLCLRWCWAQWNRIY